MGIRRRKLRRIVSLMLQPPGFPASAQTVARLGPVCARPVRRALRPDNLFRSADQQAYPEASACRTGRVLDYSVRGQAQISIRTIS